MFFSFGEFKYFSIVVGVILVFFDFDVQFEIN